jgi:hypothetical protein
MTSKPLARSAFPTPEETLALQASLLDGDRAVEAWRRLSLSGRPLDGGIAWLTPLLLANLSRLVPEDPFVRANPHHLALCGLKSRATTLCAETTLRLFEAASIPTLVLKGLALGASVYADAGLRLFSDLDLLVRREDVFRAVEVLKRHGFGALPGEPASPSDLRAAHAHTFRPPKRHDPPLDLHWHVLASARGDDDDLPFWSRATPVRVGAASTLMLGPEDQLMHVLAHGVRWTRTPHVRWVADAALVLRRTGPALRVERFLAAVEEFDLVTPVQEGLSFVSAVLGEGDGLLEEVSKLRRPPLAQRAFKARATAYEARTVADRIARRIETAIWNYRASRRRPPRGE